MTTKDQSSKFLSFNSLNGYEEGQPQTVRDMKRQKMKLVNAKQQEAKDTKTRKLYQKCLRQVTMEREQIMRENQVMFDINQPKPIKNLFKMIRVAVDYNDNNNDADMTQESWQTHQDSLRVGHESLSQ